MSDYKITDEDVEAVVRYLRVNDPENATPEVALALLEDLHSGVQDMAYNNPEKLEELNLLLKRENT